MATLRIHLEDEIARHVEKSARREHKSVSEWIKERIKPGIKRPDGLAAMEARARSNGYPANWLTLYGSLADDETFTAPARGKTRLLKKQNGN